MNNNFWDYSFEQPRTELNNVHNIFPTALFESTMTITNTEEIIENLQAGIESFKEIMLNLK